MPAAELRSRRAQHFAAHPSRGLLHERRDGAALAGRPLQQALRLQRSAGNRAVSRLLAGPRPPIADPGARSPVLDVIGRGGRPLPGALRSDMEQRLGQDFSDVRIHTDHHAHIAARSIAADAFTSGRHIAFAAGRYAPTTPNGRQMLAHELTHVVQQRTGPVSATPVGGGIALSDPSDRFERAAEHTAAHAFAE